MFCSVLSPARSTAGIWTRPGCAHLCRVSVAVVGALCLCCRRVVPGRYIQHALSMLITLSTFSNASVSEWRPLMGGSGVVGGVCVRVVRVLHGLCLVSCVCRALWSAPFSHSPLSRSISMFVQVCIENPFACALLSHHNVRDLLERCTRLCEVNVCMSGTTPGQARIAPANFSKLTHRTPRLMIKQEPCTPPPIPARVIGSAAVAPPSL